MALQFHPRTQEETAATEVAEGYPGQAIFQAEAEEPAEQHPRSLMQLHSRVPLLAVEDRELKDMAAEVAEVVQ